MDGKDFKKIKTPKNVYCLVSTDAEMVDLYVSRFKSMISADEINYGTIKSYGKLFKKTILNVLYMPKIDLDIFDRKEFIFIYTDSIDKRQTIYKKHSDQIIELKNDYTQFILDNSSMSTDEARELAKIGDLGIIKSRLTVYNEGKIGYDIVSDSFSWVDAFIQNKKLPYIIDSPISVMALLSTNCSTLVRIMNNDTTGLNQYMVHKLSAFKACRTKDELNQIISDCFYLDCQIKKGLIDISIVLNYLTKKYWRDSNATN